MTAATTRVPLAFSCVGHTYNHLFDPIFFVVALVLPAEFGMSYEEVLTLIVAGKLLWGFGAPLAGWLSDRWSATGMIAIYFLGLGATATAIGWAQTPWHLAVLLTLLGAFGSIYHPVAISWLVRHSENRGRDLGINGLFGGIGPAIAGITAAALTEGFGWRVAFVIPGLVVLATGLFFLWSVRQGWVAEIKQDLKSVPPATRGDTVRAYTILSLTMFAGGLTYQANQAGLPKLFQENAGAVLGEGLLGVGGAVMVVYAVAGLTQIIAGHLADRYSAKSVYVATLLVQPVLLGLMGQAFNLPLVMVAVLAVTFNIGQLPAENVLFARYTPPRWRGTAFGFKFVMAFGVSALGVPLVALMRGLDFGFSGLYLLLAGLVLTGGLLAFRLPDEPSYSAAE